MTPARPALFWIVTLALIGTAAVLLRDVLLPFVAAMALAYLLAPLVNRLEQIGINRGAATLLMLVGFLLAAVTALALTVPMLVSEITILFEKLPSYIDRLKALATDPNFPTLGKLVAMTMGEVEHSSGELMSLGAGWLSEALRSLWSDGRMLLSLFSLVVVTPIVTAYLVYDWNRLLGALDGLVPEPQRATVRRLAGEIDDTIAAFLRGQGMICLLLGLFYALVLRAIGLNHGVLIGLISGVLAFIPYVGSLTGLVLSVAVAIAQFGLSWPPILGVLGIFFVGQSVADYVLAPYFVGSKVHVNPVWLIFALFAFGYLFGFVGLLIAVPLAASIGVLVRFALKHNLAPAVDGSQPAPVRPEVDLGKTAPQQPWH